MFSGEKGKSFVPSRVATAVLLKLFSIRASTEESPAGPEVKLRTVHKQTFISEGTTKRPQHNILSIDATYKT